MLFAPWLRTLRARLGQSPARPARRPRRVSFRPRTELLEDRTLLSTFQVITTADNGDNTNPITGSLRDAINQVNAGLYNEIDFAVTAASDTGGGYDPTTGVATIRPLSALPAITNSVIINGYTQGQGTALAASPNNLADGNNAVLKIDLDGSQAGASAVGLDVNAPQSLVRGLDVTNWDGYGIWLDIHSSNSTVAGDFLGTDVTGQVVMPNGSGPRVQSNTFNAAVVVNSGDNLIGGTDPASRNLISGNGSVGLVIEDSYLTYHDTPPGIVTGNRVQGNFIGTDASGTKALGNAAIGIYVDHDVRDTMIGGTTPGARNIISATTGTNPVPGELPGDGLGIEANGIGTVIEGNYIGTDVTGTKALGNGEGINLHGGATIGGTAAGAGNLISGNGYGIGIATGTGIVIQGNFIGTDASGTRITDAAGNPIGNFRGIFQTGGDGVLIGGTAAGAGNVISGNDIGAELFAGNLVEGNVIASNASYGVFVVSGTGNSILSNSIFDNGDLGIVLASGANNDQAAPVLTAATTQAGSTYIGGSLTAAPYTAYRVEFFANAAADPSGSGEGERYLGFTDISTDVTGHASFLATVAGVDPALPYLSATATRLDSTTLAPTDTSAFSNDVNALASPSPYQVTTTADGGAGSLRDAIAQINLDANHVLYASPSNGGIDEIDFGITAASDTGGGYDPTTGVATIRPLSALPAITDPVVIDGYSQPGASPNTLLGTSALGSTDSTLHPENYGDNAVLKVELDGENAGTSPGLSLAADNITVQGLVINRFAATGISVGYYGSYTIRGNFLGTDVTGTQALGNGGADVLATPFQGAQLLIGGTDPAARNIVSGALNTYPVYGGGEGGFGIVITGPGGVVVQGNFIGTDVTGRRSLGNVKGILAYNNDGADVIGGPAPGAGNVIAGNGEYEVFTAGRAANVCQGNFIGTDVTGTQALGSGELALDGYSGGQVIGGPGAGNLILGIRGSHDDNVIQGNLIGTNVTGTRVLGNGNISFQDGGNNLIGGTDPGTRNVIAGGIGFASSYVPPSGNRIEGNYIGTDITGTKAISQGDVALYNGASNNTIGGTTAAARNVIVGGIIIGDNSGGTGVNLPSNNVVEGNYIGTDVTGTIVLSESTDHVILLSGALNNTIGGTAAGAGNVIAGKSIGIRFYSNGNPNDPNSGNVVQGNYIGTDPSGAQALGNGIGVVFSDFADTNNLIGGTATGAGNTIAFSGGDGVFVYAGSGNSILGNSIHDNGGLGISLNSATNANDNQAAPVLTAAYAASGATIVTGTLTSTPNATFHLEFFANAAGDPEGRTFLGSGTVTTDASGQGSFTAFLSAALPAGQGLVTATATDSSGNTSEFSAGVTATPLPPSSLSGVVWEDFNNDGQVDFGEKGIGGVAVTLTGTDFLGNAVNLPPQATDSDGAYVFLNLLPGDYYLTETQPAGYDQGIDSVGTAGGSLAATDQFFVHLGPGANGLNYNFGEQPPAGGSVQHGQTAGIGFWNNKNGQALVKSLNGGTGTQLADWLAATLPNIFGANAGSNDLAGKSNAAVAALFQQDFLLKGVKLDAQVLATALSVYATNATLDSTQAAARYGFTVSGDGAGTATVNVGLNGDAFGVANNTTLTLMDLLLAADDQAVNGVLYGGNATKRNEANSVFSAVNQAGGL